MLRRLLCTIGYNNFRPQITGMSKGFRLKINFLPDVSKNKKGETNAYN